MKEEKIPIETIEKITGLTKEEIKKLQSCFNFIKIIQ